MIGKIIRTNENQVYTHIKEKIYLYLIIGGGLDSNPLTQFDEENILATLY